MPCEDVTLGATLPSLEETNVPLRTGAGGRDPWARGSCLLCVLEVEVDVQRVGDRRVHTAGEQARDAEAGVSEDRSELDGERAAGRDATTGVAAQVIVVAGVDAEVDAGLDDPAEADDECDRDLHRRVRLHRATF